MEYTFKSHVAEKIGIRKAIMLEYISDETFGFIDTNRLYVSKTIKELAKELPFFSERTLIRVLNELEKDGYIEAAKAKELIRHPSVNGATKCYKVTDKGNELLYGGMGVFTKC